MRAIVVGLGDVGQHVVKTLTAERHEVTAVDRDPVRVEALQAELDALVLTGNGASPKFLRDLDAGEADLLCAVTQSDEANVIAALAAHQLGVAQTVARVRDEDYFGPDESFARDVMGIDVVIHPERLAADHLAEAVRLPGAVQVEHFADGRVTVAETIVGERSPLLGRALRERRNSPPHAVFGLVRDGRTIAADPGHRPQRGDHLLVAAAREDIGRVVSHLAGEAVPVEAVTIFGAGRIGLPLARRLVSLGDFRVTLMERDGERARYVAEQLPGVTVLHEEGVAKEALLAHGVDETNAFVACAGDDRANLLAALHAKQVGANLALAVVSREEFVPLVNALGLDAAVSPRLATAEATLRSLRGTHVAAMRLLVGGSEVLEVEAEPACRAQGRTVADTEATASTHVAAIVRGDRVLVVEPRLRIEAGDRVILFSPRQGLSDVRRTFQAR